MCTECGHSGELTSLLADRLVQRLPKGRDEGLVPISFAGHGISFAERIAERLHTSLRHITIQPIYWPPHSDLLVGAISGINDVLYLDHQTLKRRGIKEELILEELQAAKLRSIQRAVPFTPDPMGRTPVLICCPHLPLPILIAGVQEVALQSHCQPIVALPFLSTSVEAALKKHVTEIISLRQFDDSPPH